MRWQENVGLGDRMGRPCRLVYGKRESALDNTGTISVLLRSLPDYGERPGRNLFARNVVKHF